MSALQDILSCTAVQGRVMNFLTAQDRTGLNRASRIAGQGGRTGQDKNECPVTVSDNYPSLSLSLPRVHRRRIRHAMIYECRLITITTFGRKVRIVTNLDPIYKPFAR